MSDPAEECFLKNSPLETVAWREISNEEGINREFGLFQSLSDICSFFIKRQSQKKEQWHDAPLPPVRYCV